jgi:hypothetical protein
MLEDIGAMIRVSLEEIEAETTIVVEAGELESAVVDIIDAGTASERADGQIEDLLEVAQGLENLLDIATESLQAGGLTTTDAKLFKIAVESYSSRVEGLTFSPTPALEAFGGTASRHETTTVAMEGLVENLKAVWEHIKAAFKKAWDMAAEFLDRLLSGATMLEKRAKRLTSDVDATKGKPQGTVSVNGSKLGYDGKTDAKSIVDGLTATEKTLDAVLGKGVDLVADHFDKVTGAFASATGTFEFSEDVGKQTGTLSGGWELHGLFLSMTRKQIKSATIDTPDLGRIKAFGLRGLEIAKLISTRRSAVNSLKTKSTAALKAIDSFVKTVGEKSENTENAKTAMKFMRINAVGKITHITNAAFVSAIAAVTLGERALKNYRTTEA